MGIKVPQIDDPVCLAMPALDFNFAAARYQSKSISSSVTFTFSNIPAQGLDVIGRLELTTTASSLTPTFTGIVWAGGTAPTFATAGVYELTFSRSATTGALRGQVSQRFAS